jgi:Trk-type K+ transport system membrane component
VTAISGSVSALATFGPALGGLDVGTALAGVDHDALLVMMFLMFAGRVELYPVLDGVVAMVSWPARRLRALIMDPIADRSDRLTGARGSERRDPS